MPTQVKDDDPEITAISRVYLALKDLDQAAQNRVLDYIAQKLGLGAHKLAKPDVETPPATHEDPQSPEDIADKPEALADNDLEGISPVAQKWMRRNTLSSSQLSSIFSLGIEEIDLVAKTVPGKSKRERMRNVLLLTGVAAYLSSGATRFTFEHAKEAGLHYNAFDSANFAASVRDFAADVSGNSEAGFSLTARGLTSATELIKQMANSTV